MAKNPINLMKARAESSEIRHKKLVKEHNELIKESIILENKVQDYEEAISGMCNGCITKGLPECSTCHLYDVAIENALWKEME